MLAKLEKKRHLCGFGGLHGVVSLVPNRAPSTSGLSELGSGIQKSPTISNALIVECIVVPTASRIGSGYREIPEPIAHLLFLSFEGFGS
jgi:hypothetical protein